MHADTHITRLFDMIHRDLGLTNEELGVILGANPRMIDRWYQGIVAPGPVASDRLDQLARLHQRLYHIFEIHDVLAWLRTPNEHLHWISPAAALQSGRAKDVIEAIDKIGYRLYH